MEKSSESTISLRQLDLKYLQTNKSKNYTLKNETFLKNFQTLCFLKRRQMEVLEKLGY